MIVLERVRWLADFWIIHFWNAAASSSSVSMAYVSQTLFSRSRVTASVTAHFMFILCSILFYSVPFDSIVFPFAQIRYPQFSIQSLDIEITKPINAHHMIIECGLGEWLAFLARRGREGSRNVLATARTCIHTFSMDSINLSRQINEEKTLFCSRWIRANYCWGWTREHWAKRVNKYHVKAVWPIYLY